MKVINLANFVTLVRVLLIPFIVFNIIEENVIYLAILIFIFYLLDKLDGMIARWMKTASKFGRFFDSITDGLNKVTILIVFFVIEKLELLWFSFICFYYLLVSFYYLSYFKNKTKLGYYLYFNKIFTILLFSTFFSILLNFYQDIFLKITLILCLFLTIILIYTIIKSNI